MRTQINGKVSTRVLTKRKASVQSTNSHKHRSIAGWTWMCVIQSVLLGLVREWTTTVSNHQTRKWTHNNNINRVSDAAAQGYSALGATKEELQDIAKSEGHGSVDLAEEAEKLKKATGKETLDIYDMAKLHGL